MALTAHMVTIDCADPRNLAKFWVEAVGYEVKADLADGAFLVLSNPGGGGVRLGLQRVPEPREGKNRVHVDWTAEDRRAEVKRITGLGATEIEEHTYPGLAWTVLTDPEGTVFCVSGRE
jgi:hypothetical protein